MYIKGVDEMPFVQYRIGFGAQKMNGVFKTEIGEYFAQHNPRKIQNCQGTYACERVSGNFVNEVRFLHTALILTPKVQISRFTTKKQS